MLPVNISAQNRDGYTVALAGLPASSNPWKEGTLGHAAWSFGWDCGRVARPAHRLFRLVSVLAVVLPRKGSRP